MRSGLLGDRSVHASLVAKPCETASTGFQHTRVTSEPGGQRSVDAFAAPRVTRGIPCPCHQPWGLHAGALEWSRGLLCSGRQGAGSAGQRGSCHSHARITHPRGGDTLRPGSARPWPSRIRGCARRPPLHGYGHASAVRCAFLCCVLCFGGAGRALASPDPNHFGSLLARRSPPGALRGRLRGRMPASAPMG